MTELQPMKMAAAEALYSTESRRRSPLHHRHARRTAASVGQLKIPGLLSFLATGSPTATVAGHQRPAGRVRRAVRRRATTRRSSRSPTGRFRLMIGFGCWPARCRPASALWRHPQGPHPDAARGCWAARAVAHAALPFLANSFGWIFTEMGRQPWIVFGEMLDPRHGVVAAAVSPSGRGAHLADRLHPALRRPRRRRGQADAPLRQGRAAGRRAAASRRTPTTTDRRPTPARLRLLTRRRPSWTLTTVWFVLIAVLWTGYFVLEGFDFGVGMLLPVLGRDDTRTRASLINTIGPVWDGNEVWLLTAGGATFAAFPEWYATLFSGFYLPLLLILLALIVRGVAFEYRGKRRRAPRWRRRWDAAIVVGSCVPALLWGVAFGNIVARRAARRRPRVRRRPAGPAQPVRAARRR